MLVYRLFEIIYILLRENKMPARELAELLGVSRRIICWDIEMLSLAGVPAYAEISKGGGKIHNNKDDERYSRAHIRPHYDDG